MSSNFQKKITSDAYQLRRDMFRFLKQRKKTLKQRQKSVVVVNYLYNFQAMSSDASQLTTQSFEPNKKLHTFTKP